VPHDHAHQHHAADRVGTRNLWIAVSINLALTVAQVVGGLLSGSLALVADAVHNLSDALALGLALGARRVARRPADHRRSFGYRRAEVVAASANLTALMVVAFFLASEAVARIFERPVIDGWTVVIVAGVALLVDAATAWLTYRASGGSSNMRAVFVHNLADALASVAVILAGAAIILFDAYWVDLVVTLLISVYIFAHALREARPVFQILMDGVPPGVSLDELRDACRAGVDGVRDVHHAHVWQIDERHRAAELHVVVPEARLPELPRIKRDVKALLRDRFGVHHATLEFELPSEAAGLAGDHGLTVPPH